MQLDSVRVGFFQEQRHAYMRMRVRATIASNGMQSGANSRKDATGSYRLAFLLVIACCIISVAAIWIAAPRNVRLVAGRISSE
jgi:hypothetical protein